MRLPNPFSSFKKKAPAANPPQQTVSPNNQQTIDTEKITKDRDQLGLALQNIAEAVMVTNQQGLIIFFNRAATDLLGFDHSILGKSIGQVVKVQNDLNPVLSSTFCPSVPGIAYTQAGLKFTNLLNSKEAFINLTSTPTNNQTLGIGCILTLHDASREKQLEQMKLDFVSMAAHELRTPITSIKGYLDVYVKENEGKISPEQLALLDQIKHSSLHLSQLVDNLLNVTKIERGAFTVNLENINLQDVIQQTVNELIFKAQSKNQHLFFEQPQQVLPTIQADKLRIGEVMANLISNAINYSPTGSTIKISAEQNDKEIITRVQDNGPGIPKDQIDKLFHKFYRVHRQLEQKSNGTGLGLFISKAIIEMHKGKIWVESEEGKGSTFGFSLPTASTTDLSFKVTDPVADILNSVK